MPNRLSCANTVAAYRGRGWTGGFHDEGLDTLRYRRGGRDGDVLAIDRSGWRRVFRAGGSYRSPPEVRMARVDDRRCTALDAGQCDLAQPGRDGCREVECSALASLRRPGLSRGDEAVSQT